MAAPQGKEAAARRSETALDRLIIQTQANRSGVIRAAAAATAQGRIGGKGARAGESPARMRGTGLPWL